MNKEPPLLITTILHASPILYVKLKYTCKFRHHLMKAHYISRLLLYIYKPDCYGVVRQFNLYIVIKFPQYQDHGCDMIGHMTSIYQCRYLAAGQLARMLVFPNYPIWVVTVIIYNGGQCHRPLRRHPTDPNYGSLI